MGVRGHFHYSGFEIERMTTPFLGGLDLGKFDLGNSWNLTSILGLKNSLKKWFYTIVRKWCHFLGHLFILGPILKLFLLFLGPKMTIFL